MIPKGKPDAKKKKNKKKIFELKIRWLNIMPNKLINLYVIYTNKKH